MPSAPRSAAPDGFDKGQAFAEDGAHRQCVALAFGFAAQTAHEHIQLIVIMRRRNAKHLDADFVLADDLTRIAGKTGEQGDFAPAQRYRSTIWRCEARRQQVQRPRSDYLRRINRRKPPVVGGNPIRWLSSANRRSKKAFQTIENNWSHGWLQLSVLLYIARIHLTIVFTSASGALTGGWFLPSIILATTVASTPALPL